MNKRIFSAIAAVAASLCLSIGATAQTAKEIGMITLNPFIPESENLGAKAASMLNTKLQQIATVNGMAGAGFDNRFIITAHVQTLRSSQTQTIPQKNAVELSIGIYVGDGLDGTLFSSYSCEAKGIGDSEDQAMAAAIRRVSAMNPELQTAIARGKQQILSYYDKQSANILKSAQAAAASGKYDDAVNMLFAIPSANKDFQQAQALIGKYASQSLEAKNLEVVSRARSAWSADPTEGGATVASGILDEIEAPSAKVKQQVAALQQEMSARLKAIDDREARLEAQKAQNEKDVQIATVNAAAKVAKAYVQSRPKVVYHYYWW